MIVKDLPRYFLQWLVLASLVGLLAGSASAVFLLALDWATQYREAHSWLIFLLPIAGFGIGYIYYHYGANSGQGTNLLLEEHYQSRHPIPFRMAPLVFFGTVFTHLFGGSAGREGTALQMGGSFADQISRLFSLTSEDRTIALTCGVSAGFASVFGTPLAGAVFALEWTMVRKINWKSVFPVFLASAVADVICEFAWGVGHTSYSIGLVPSISFTSLAWVIPAGILFGLAARLFSEVGHWVSSFFQKIISYPPLRPVLGGALLAGIVYFSGNTTYLGLGIPRIVEAFEQPLPWYDWLLKTGATGLTLGSGFKGGEVTPLFFTGATLGNSIATWIPLPFALLAGMGFVSVFAGATNTPLASTLMGMELFGPAPGLFLALSCLVAYFSSGNRGIYSSQKMDSKYR